ncbi:MAG: molecular chaperone TorD family protein [Gammaproteobacteria bacterium]|jgi:DMSO reductase family type II enzyme chaperone|nr:molecular chaperone TorD family protein [Gammaproteobacteria bacterium]
MEHGLLDVAQQRCAAYQYFADAFRYPQHETAEKQERQLQYIANFECSAHQGACSLHEATYSTEGQEVLYEELTRFYEFFGLKRDHRAELPDHLTVELEFMHYLSFREAHVAGGEQAKESLVKAQRDFVDRHLRHLVTGVLETFPGSSGHYRELLDDLSVFINDEKRYLITN